MVSESAQKEIYVTGGAGLIGSFLSEILVKNNKDVHILMSDFNYDAKGEMGDGGNTTVIPTKNVIHKKEVKL